MSEFNEPWKVNRGQWDQYVSDANGNTLYSTQTDGNLFFTDEQIRRAVACINFCAGLETDFIQGQPLIGRPTLMGQPYVKKFNCAESLEQRDRLIKKAQENANG